MCSLASPTTRGRGNASYRPNACHSRTPDGVRRSCRGGEPELLSGSSGGEHPWAVGGDGHGVLHVRREAPVGSHHGPAISEDAHVASPLIEHGLDGKHHSGSEAGSLAGFAVVWHAG